MFRHTISPTAFTVGNIQIHWYGLMYLAGFALGWALGRYRASRPDSGWTKTEVDDLLTATMLGVILGGRLGYVLFYDLPSYLSDPLEIIKIWHGGMSFHGGLLGALAAFLYFAKTRRKSFWDVSDFVTPLVPQAIFWGRLGNFINGELWGKPTDLSWGVIFRGAGELPRHPTQLYEALIEGLLLFIVIWVYSSKKRRPGQISGLFAVGYGVGRILIEFVRLPDAHIGYIAFGWLTMGQILCGPLILVGLWLLFRKPASSDEKTRESKVGQ
ncbi:MAG: prolipoprotein diacylglyceryl transferase [Desulfovibrio sp.]|nr:prolipoprotein diacylglyceryl transferase [Desulfovibrio sp.]